MKTAVVMTVGSVMTRDATRVMPVVDRDREPLPVARIRRDLVRGSVR